MAPVLIILGAVLFLGGFFLALTSDDEGGKLAALLMFFLGISLLVGAGLGFIFAHMRFVR